MNNKFSFPTEIVSLPSKGLVYPETSTLSSGSIEIRYMSARHEDILTNINYIKNGTVIDKLLQALIVTPINYDDLIIGDKNAILIASRILGYGKEYKFKYKVGREEKEANVDLTSIKEKDLDLSLYTKGINEFGFLLPNSGNNITFKILTQKDEKAIEAENKGLKKIDANSSHEVTTTLKFMITSVEGIREKKDIREFVDNYLTARDARELRNYYNKISPNIELKYYPEDEGYTEEGIEIPININFFWPDL